MVNENFEPSDRQEKLLSVLTEGRANGEPWGYATVKRFTEETDLRKQYVNREINGLVDAGWVEKPYRGLYRFVEDPQEDVTEPVKRFDALLKAFDDIETAFDHGDGDATREALKRAQEAMSDVNSEYDSD